MPEELIKPEVMKSTMPDDEKSSDVAAEAAIPPVSRDCLTIVLFRKVSIMSSMQLLIPKRNTLPRIRMSEGSIENFTKPVPLIEIIRYTAHTS